MYHQTEDLRLDKTTDAGELFCIQYCFVAMEVISAKRMMPSGSQQNVPAHGELL